MNQDIDLRAKPTKKAYIDYLYYGVGKQHAELSLAQSHKNREGQVIWSKWRPYLDAQADPYFISRACHRTLLNNEVVIDIDHPTIQENKEQSSIIKQYLEKQGYGYWEFFTGSKGIHIHLFFAHLDRAPSHRRQRFRSLFLNKWEGTDHQKASDRSMIALEHEPHWKTGNKKTLLTYQKKRNVFWGNQR